MPVCMVVCVAVAEAEQGRRDAAIRRSFIVADRMAFAAVSLMDVHTSVNGFHR